MFAFTAGDRATCLFVAAIALTSASVHAAPSVKAPATAPIQQIDHIMIRTDKPGDLYGFFTKVLELPVAWPLAKRGEVASGGVGFGNVNVEAIQFPGQPPHSQLVGFGFEPSPLRDCLAELDRRGITYGPQRPFIVTAPDGSKRTLWTNVTLQQFSDADRPAQATVHIFLSEYDPAYVNVEERRKRLRAHLIENAGGPMGVNGVKEMVVGVRDVDAARVLWQKLLDPAPSLASTLWRAGDGPAVRLVPSQENGIQELVIGVASLRQAKTFLGKKDLLGSHTDVDAVIDPTKVHGLAIRVVEWKPLAQP